MNQPNTLATLPAQWQQDPYFLYYFDGPMTAKEWDRAKEWHDKLREYVATTYLVEFDNYFDWSLYSVPEHNA